LAQLTGIIQDQVDNQPNLQQTFEVCIYSDCDSVNVVADLVTFILERTGSYFGSHWTMHWTIGLTDTNNLVSVTLTLVGWSVTP